MQAHLTLKSSNAKTGPIPVSTTERQSCGDCAYKRNGCYADYGPLGLHWNAVSAGKRGTGWAGFCSQIRALPEGQLWRHNQAGDLPHVHGNIHLGKLFDLLGANVGKRGYTYTHHDLRRPSNERAVRAANSYGFTVNVSADTFLQADAYMDKQLPTVIVLPSDHAVNCATPKGRKVVLCPATQSDDVTCATCQLCQRSSRKVVIGFPAHGSGKAKVTSIFNA